MYTSLVIPVPAENMDACRTWAQMSGRSSRNRGAWRSSKFIPEGKRTDWLGTTLR